MTYSKKDIIGELIGKELCNIIIDKNLQQKDIANQMQISPATLSSMLSGDTAFAPTRFFQLLAILELTKNEIGYFFSLYRKKIVHQRLTELKELTNPTITELKEIDIMEMWIGAKSSSIREEVHALVDQLTDAELLPFKSLMQAIIDKK